MPNRYQLPLCALLCLLCSFRVNAQADTSIGIHVDKQDTRSIQRLAHALCDDQPSDYGKANAIYNWITHNIKYNAKALQAGKLKEEKATVVLKQRKGMCDGYSKLFVALCREAGVPALEITGYAKDWIFDDGDKLYVPRHAWNAVYIDHKWQLVDATWGAGGLGQSPGWLKQKMNKMSKGPAMASGKLKFKFHYNPAYFLTDPMTFRVNHLPSDPIWQLTDNPMPIEIFEAGAAAVTTYNEIHPGLQQNTQEQAQIGSMNELHREQASAERVNGYNPRNYISLAAKHQADAIDSVTAYVGGRAQADKAGTLATLHHKIEDASVAVKAQKKTIPTEYRVLKTKNKTKNLLAKQYIHSINSDNKRLTAQCKTHISSIVNRRKTIYNKMLAAQKKERQTRLALGTPTRAKAMHGSMAALQVLQDSITARDNRITFYSDEADVQEARIAGYKKQNYTLLDTLADIMGLADSALVQETIGRLNMHDNYDEEVMQWNRIVKTARLQQVDTLQKQYLAGYDSILLHYETLRKQQWEQVDLYRKNLKDIAQYRRLNSGSTDRLANDFDSERQDYDSTVAIYYGVLHDYDGYINGNKGLFEKLVRLYKRQEKLAGYMEQSEEKRKKLEEQHLVKKEAFDKKENDLQQAQLKKTTREGEQLVAGNGPKKKRRQRQAS